MTNRRAWLFSGLLLGAGCAHGRESRALDRASASVARAALRGHVDRFEDHLLPASRPNVDMEAIMSQGRTWHRRLRRPQAAQLEATAFLARDLPVRMARTPEGWRFVEDPSDVFGQHTPEASLRALVLASRSKRFDVLLALAPRRYRSGLSVEDLEKAWSDPEYGRVLRSAVEAIAQRLADPVIGDDHEAALQIAQGHVVRLERENTRWVIVDFVPQS